MLQVFRNRARHERTERSIREGGMLRFYVKAGRRSVLLLQQLESHLSPFQKKIVLLLFSMMAGTYFMYLIITGAAGRSATPAVNFRGVHLPALPIPADSIALYPKK